MPADTHRLKIGDPAPDFSLKGVDGKTYSLADFKDAPILMVAFLSNHCPYSHAAETRLIPLTNEMKLRGMAVVAINPNSSSAVGLSELGYSKYSDSFDEMKLYAKSAGSSSRIFTTATRSRPPRRMDAFVRRTCFSSIRTPSALHGAAG